MKYEEVFVHFFDEKATKIKNKLNRIESNRMLLNTCRLAAMRNEYIHFQIIFNENGGKK